MGEADGPPEGFQEQEEVEASLEEQAGFPARGGPFQGRQLTATWASPGTETVSMAISEPTADVGEKREEDAEQKQKIDLLSKQGEETCGHPSR